MEIFLKDGEISIVDKWSKTEMALKNGADLVIELPTVYSVSSAENFAEGAVKILSSFNMPTTLSFGSECGDVDTLSKFADVLLKEPKEYRSILNHELQTGISYAKARENALLMYLNDIRKYANVLSEPNNILGIEYIKAIKKGKTNIQPLTIKRVGTKYNSKETKAKFASATAIRDMIFNNNNDNNNEINLEEIKNFVPKSTFDILKNKHKYGQLISDIKVFEKEILYTLRKMSTDDILDLPDVSEGLENRIKQASDVCNNLEDLIEKIKSKRYTRTRIQRILIYALLGITKRDIDISYRTIPYIRVLGVNSKGKILLSRLSSINKKIQVVTSVKKFMDTCNDKNLRAMMEKDILATNIYTLAYGFDSKSNLDYTKKIINV